MTISLQDLAQIDQHWAVQSLSGEMRATALDLADSLLVKSSLGQLLHNNASSIIYEFELVEQVAMVYELAAIEGLNVLLYPAKSNESLALQRSAQAGAHRAFGLYRILPIPSDADKRIFHVLHLAGLAYCGERWTDLRRWFVDHQESFAIPSIADVSWDTRVLYRLFDAWIRLLRKDRWDDLEQVSLIILGLRTDQAEFEKELLEGAAGHGQSIALRLIALYHFAKATERLAMYMLQGEPSSIATELDQHFEAAVKAAQKSQDSQFEMILRWLHVASRKMAAGSLWWVAHAVNSRVTRFVDQITKHRSMFELLPPQRAAIQELGLLDQANRAVVVEMPTSGGKTQLAQFRILQALNQFAQDDGWVVYIAPTRALVSQITRRLRSDFEPLGIHVAQLVGAIEIDSFEENLLNKEQAFQVLVVTPEKLQLVMRNKKVKRPLALVVMDEAHNIEDEERGLRIELLLATIKHEAPKANFLLMMPFVPNAEDLAQWLGADRGRSISLSTSAWQPNERIVGIFNRIPCEKKGDWRLTFETLITTQRTINLKGVYEVDGVRPIPKLSYSTAKTLSGQAVAMAKAFSKRGTSIAVAQKIPDAWSMARTVSEALEPFDTIHEDIRLVQRFLATEISPEFELIEMLSKGVALHHAGLPAEVLALIEWLTENDRIRILCATTTIAQGLNFPVSSVFLASTDFIYGKKMSHRTFWNLAGRAGRIGHGSVGVVGIAAGDNPDEIKKYVSAATGSLISRLEILLEELLQRGELNNLKLILKHDQWADFRSYIAHLWNEKQNLDTVISEAEQTLRNTFGFGALRAKQDILSQEKADALLDATRSYAQELAQHPENAVLADSTGFSPEGVRTALLSMTQLDISQEDWHPSSLFGSNSSSLADLMGVMIQIPQLKKGLDDIKGSGPGHRKLADITKAWVSGESLAKIAETHFDGDSLTDKISKACKALYRDLANNGAWGLSALSKMPTAGIDFEKLSEVERQQINNLPAMLYHGVRSEEAVVMRMNFVPRSIAESVGADYKAVVKTKDTLPSSKDVNEYLKSLRSEDWERLKPNTSRMTGDDYKKIWNQLSGISL